MNIIVFILGVAWFGFLGYLIFNDFFYKRSRFKDTFIWSTKDLKKTPVAEFEIVSKRDGKIDSCLITFKKKSLLPFSSKEQRVVYYCENLRGFGDSGKVFDAETGDDLWFKYDSGFVMAVRAMIDNQESRAYIKNKIDEHYSKAISLYESELDKKFKELEQQKGRVIGIKSRIAESFSPTTMEQELDCLNDDEYKKKSKVRRG